MQRVEIAREHVRALDMLSDSGQRGFKTFTDGDVKFLDRVVLSADFAPYRAAVPVVAAYIAARGLTVQTSVT